MMMKVLRRALAIGLAGTMLMGAISVTAASPRDLFDADYYAELYPDVVAAVGDDEAALYNHYIKHGMKEGRSLSPIFDVQSYRDRYSDLEAAFGDDWSAYMNHMLEHGLYENRHTVDKDVHALTSEQALTLYAAKINAKVEKEGVESVLGEFDTEAYKAANPDVANAFGNNVKALVKHYLEHGIKEGRTSTSDKSKDPVEAIKKNPDIITIVAEPIPEKIVEKAEEVKKPSAPAVHQCSFYAVDGTCLTGIQMACGCGKNYTDNSRVELGCQWTDIKICLVEAGCYTNRVVAYQCLHCKDTRDEEVCGTVHDDWEDWLIEIYKQEANCPICGILITNPEPHDHVFANDYVMPLDKADGGPGCTTPGLGYRVCQLCNEDVYEQLPSNHDQDMEWLREHPDVGSMTCSDCGTVITREDL